VYGASGHSIHIQELCRAFAKGGDEVFILASRKGDEEKYVHPTPVCELGPRVSLLPTRARMFNAQSAGSPDEPATPPSTSLSPLRLARDTARLAKWSAWDAYFYRRARKVIALERPDFLYERYVRGASAGARLAAEFHLPFILEMNTSFTFPLEWWDDHSPLVPWAVARTERRNTTAADRVVVVSSHLRDYLRGTGVPDEKLELMFNAADIDRFRTNASQAHEIRERYGLGERTIVVGFVGSLKPWHGVDVLLKSFHESLKEHPGLRLLIVGDGPMRHFLESFTRSALATDCVTFTGPVAHAQTPAYIAAMDIAVAPAPPSPSNHLSPLKLFEYMASSRPIIAAAYSDIPKIVQHRENGILVDPGSVDQIAAAILELARDVDFRHRLGRSAQQTVRHSYTWQQNAERILALFSDIEARKLEPHRSRGGDPALGR